jgi:membrane protein required for colicin V production
MVKLFRPPLVSCLITPTPDSCLSAFDLFLLIPISYGAFKGYRRGLFMELISLVALLIGIIGGLKFLNGSLPVMREYVGNVFGLLPILTFILIFVLIILGVKLLGLLVKKAIDFTPLGAVDNVVGGVLGALKWCFGISLLLYVAGLAGLQVSEETARSSFVYPRLLLFTPVALKAIGLLMPFVRTLLQNLRAHF